VRSSHDTSDSTEPTSVLVHTCGLHGVEGYVGSAIQRHLLTQAGFLGQLQALQTGQMVIIAHAVNPHGMAWWERFNENNVDLNRNCVTVAGTPTESAAKFQDLISKPYTEYLELDGLINPAEVGACDCFPIKAACTIMQYGIPHLKRATVSGQYIKQDGVFYGGASLQESVSLLLQQLQQLGVSRHNPNLAHLTHIDVHSGLGSPGQEALLIGPGSPLVLLRACVGVPAEGRSGGANASDFKVQPSRTDGVSYPMYGTLNAAVSLLAGPQPAALLATAVPAAPGMAGGEEFQYAAPGDNEGNTQVESDSKSAAAAAQVEQDGIAVETKGAAGAGAAGRPPRGRDCVKMCLAQEFGTLPPADVLRALRGLNAAMYGGGPGDGSRRDVPIDSPERKAVLAAFFVDTDAWKFDMLRKGQDTACRLMAATFDDATLAAHLSTAGVSPETVLQASASRGGASAVAAASTSVVKEDHISVASAVGTSVSEAKQPPLPNSLSEYDDAIRAIPSSATQGSVASEDRTTV